MRSSVAFWRVLIEDVLVHHLDGRGLVEQDDGRGGERFEQVGESDHHNGLCFRQRDQAQLRFEHHAQRSFRADHDLGQVDGLGGVGELVQVVAADAPQDFRVAAVDLGGVVGGEPQHSAIAGGFERIARGNFSPRDLAEVSDAGVGKNDRLLEHVVDGFPYRTLRAPHELLAIMPPMVARLAVEMSGANRRPKRRKLRVQLVEHHARLDARPALASAFTSRTRLIVLRRVDLNALSDGLSGLRRAASAHGEGAAEAAADFDGADDIFAILGNDHAQRPDLIDAGVGGIERARRWCRSAPHLGSLGRVRAAEPRHPPGAHPPEGPAFPLLTAPGSLAMLRDGESQHHWRITKGGGRINLPAARRRL